MVGQLIRWPAKCPNHSFHGRHAGSPIYNGASVDGGAGRSVERNPLDDYRPLRGPLGQIKVKKLIWSRRQMLLRGSAAFGGLMLAGCDRLSRSSTFLQFLGSAEHLTYRTQRLLIGHSLAREFPESDLSPVFRSNGTSDPNNDLYNRLRADNFYQWRLTVGGLVEHPLELSLAALRAMPARTQITRHDCVEGWSAIGKWTGVPLARVLDLAQLGAQT